MLAANRAPELLAGLVVVASGVSMPVHPSLWGMLEDGGETAVIRRFAAAAPRSIQVVRRPRPRPYRRGWRR